MPNTECLCSNLQDRRAFSGMLPGAPEIATILCTMLSGSFKMAECYKLVNYYIELILRALASLGLYLRFWKRLDPEGEYGSYIFSTPSCPNASSDGGGNAVGSCLLTVIK